MHTCPHCRAQAVPPFQVRWSSRESPARCTACGKLSHVLASTSSGIGSMWFVLAICVVVAALWAPSWWVGAAGLAGVVAYNRWAWRQVELFPIPPEAAKTAARVAWYVTVLNIVLLALR